ncbi:hypothetical protein QCA50_000669 [Cerrena zonata]|uniref:TLC domain-containing protein n=1 Tax=Cerrena zonata TaxID=2478898 RepID=A0AAW0GR02_9APHY
MNTLEAPEWLPSFAIPFFTLSYPTPPPAVPDSFPNSKYYSTGLLDGCLIITIIAVFAILRDVARVYIMEPFAHWKLTRDLRLKHAKAVGRANGKANGHSSPSKTNGVANGNGHAAPQEFVITKAEARHLHRSVIRFAEQGWSFIYYTAQWSFGSYVHYNLPTTMLNPVEVWHGYPHIPLAGPLKFYYLTETAFYLHQFLILNAEARRKDHWQMMTHHVITVILMIGSYSYNYTRIGCLIMLLMDLSDVFLPLAKMFRYLSMSLACDVMSACFMLSWFVTRHALFLLVIKSTYFDALRIIPEAWDPTTGHYITKEVILGFNIMLIALQILQLMWFSIIVRVAWKIINGQGAQDERSDSEGDVDDSSPERESKKER